MLTRLYFVLPSVETARQVERELLLARIEDRRIHFLARRGTDLGDLPEAAVTQRTDFVHALWIGLVAGGITGAIVGGIAFSFPEVESKLGLGWILIFGSSGASFGVWVSGMIGASVPNSQLKDYQKSIEAGSVLLMVDVPKDQAEKITSLILKEHPEVSGARSGPLLPALP
ncbi:MAG: DUF1269 domain-containing protein [Gammaproteobacteria bacterium]